MKEITRSIPVSTIQCVDVKIVNGEFQKVELDTITIVGRELTLEKADKEIKKIYKNFKNPMAVNVNVTYDVYSLSLDDFMKYGKKLVKAEAEAEEEIDKTEENK